MDRKDFFTKGFKLALGKSLELLSDNKIISTIESFAERRQRPPGAHPSEATFQERCIGCDACMVACPANVVMVEDMEKRYPVIFPDKDPCILCPDTPCITACEVSALELSNGLTPKELTNDPHDSPATT